MIQFQMGRHDDGYPFDGRGGTLAHGFYPLDNTGMYIELFSWNIQEGLKEQFMQV